ncbi:MAG: 50S ribosomal protein L17 [Bacteroidota bacterium]|jgi:large subunit ribosomal protein L17
MRHQKTINHLGRTSAHRKAMLSNMAASLILHKRITTTLAKAKALRGYVEPLISRAKDDSTHSRRVVFSYLQNKDAVTELFKEISKKIMERPGGYTRILKTGMRAGDNADMCFIELVDYNEAMLGKKEDAKAKTTRRGRKGTKQAEDAEKHAPKAEEKEVKKPKKAAKKAEESKAPAEAKPEESTETAES